MYTSDKSTVDIFSAQVFSMNNVNISYCILRFTSTYKVPFTTKVVSLIPVRIKVYSYNFMWYSLSLTGGRSVVFCGYSNSPLIRPSLLQEGWPLLRGTIQQYLTISVHLKSGLTRGVALLDGIYCTMISCNNKTYLHDITEILLKVVLLQPQKHMTDPQQPLKYLTYPQQPLKYLTDPQQPLKYLTDPRQPLKYLIDPQQPLKYLTDPQQPLKYLTDPQQPLKYLTDPWQLLQQLPPLHLQHFLHCICISLQHLLCLSLLKLFLEPDLQHK